MIGQDYKIRKQQNIPIKQQILSRELYEAKSNMKVSLMIYMITGYMYNHEIEK